MKSTQLILSLAAGICLTPQAFAAVFLIDFSTNSGSPDSSVNTWQVISAAGTTATPVTTTEIRDTGGTASTISITTSGFVSSSGQNTVTPQASLGSLADANAIADWFYVDDGESATITILGLSAAELYTFDLIGSRPVNGTAAEPNLRTTTYSINGVSQNQVTSGFNSGVGENRNNNTLTTFSNIAPTSGSITIDITTNSNFAYINAMRMTSSPVPEPSASALFALGLLTLVAARRRNS